MPVPARGLLLTYTEPGRALPPSTYETWHDTQHVWRLLNLPGPLFLSATRWTAADTKTPGHIAIYDLASPSAVYDPGYAALIEPDSGYDSDSDRTSEEREEELEGGRRERRTGTTNDVLQKVESIERRVYELIADESRASRNVNAPVLDHDRNESDGSEDGHGVAAWCEPGKYMTVIEVEMMTYAEGEFNRWFDEEHIPLLARVPGWVRSRRFVLKEVLGADGWDGDGVDSDQNSERARRHVAGYGRGREVKEERPPKYLALHEWSSLDAFRSKEFKRATTTPWRTHVLKEDRVLKYEIRVFKIAGNWQRF